MSLAADAALWWRTLGPLPARMHAFRLANDARKALWRPGLPALVALWRQRGQDGARLARHEPLLALGAALAAAPLPDAKALLGGEFILAGRPVCAFPPRDWSLPEARPLEVYEAHYLDWADAWTADVVLPGNREPGRDLAALHETLQAWVTQSARLEKPWEPYPRARRTLAATRAAARLTTVEHRGRDRWTDKHMAVRDLLLAVAAAAAADLGLFAERHLDGNHLLVDRAAQAAAELTWGHGSRACEALTAEVARQFPGDGAHVEASAMYHALLIEDLLTVRALWPLAANRLGFEHLLARALAWLAAVVHPDGSLPAFGDSDAEALAQLPLTRTALAALPAGSPDPRQSVYASRLGGHLLLVHTAPPVWTLQPGHAHADTLALEWSRNDVRILADAGLGGYEGDPRRQLNRSGASHSTLEVLGVPQLELWGAFRVGARGRLRHVESGRIDGWDWLAAVHEWPTRSHNHLRLCAQHPAGRLVVADAVEGPGDAVVRFLLAPGVEAASPAQLRAGRDRVAISSSSPLELLESVRFHRRTAVDGRELRARLRGDEHWLVLGGGTWQEARERFAAPWSALAGQLRLG